MVFTHSVFDFLPDHWLKGTRFSHEKYFNNILMSKDWPGRKIIKFALNHPHLRSEVELFKKLINPDSRFRLEAKLINSQANLYGSKQIEKTRDIIHENRKYMGISTNNEIQLDNIIKGNVLSNCIHWKLPELRFALYREEPDIVLKYRFCGYFPPDFNYRIHIRQYKKGMFYGAFNKGRFKNSCENCRLLGYLSSEQV